MPFNKLDQTSDANFRPAPMFWCNYPFPF